MIALRAVLPGGTELVPWTDKKGRFHPLRAATLALLLLPGIYLAARWSMGMLGPRAVNAAIHSTGYYAVWILIASLVVTPAKALLGLPNLVVIRRMLGNAALVYAAIHLVLYAADQNWRLGTIVLEILSRFYLTIGFVTLLGLLVLGLTSTDGWARAMGRGWKRLHRIVYALGAVALFHYVLQSKLDVSQAMVAGGAFTWLMLWRALPAGRDRAWLPLVGLSVAAAAMTLLFEYVWYRFGTRINPMRVLRGELDVAFGLHPAGQVLALGLLATGLAELRRLSLTRFGQGPLYTMGVYALGSLYDDVTALFMGWPMTEDGEPGPVGVDILWALLLALLGMARWKLRRERLRHLLDLVWLACVLQQVFSIGTGTQRIASAIAAIIVAATILLGHRVWSVSRGAALTLVPLGLLLAYEALSLL